MERRYFFGTQMTQIEQICAAYKTTLVINTKIRSRHASVFNVICIKILHRDGEPFKRSGKHHGGWARIGVKLHAASFAPGVPSGQAEARPERIPG